MLFMHLQIDNIFSKIHDRIILFRYILPFVRKNADRPITPENTLCLFCHPRGGSTWLTELFLHLKNSVLIDEPLWRGKFTLPFIRPDYYIRKVPQISDLDFYFHQYIPEHVDWPEASNAFENILSGKTISIGLYDEQDLRKLKKGEIYITKFCYANLLLPWLVRQFSFNAILLTRHPCAVVASQLKFPAWRDMIIPKELKIADFPYSEFYHSAMEKVGGIDSVEKYLALIWALGFKNTAMHPMNNKKWLTMSYEGLLGNYSSEMNRLNQRFSYGLHILDINHKKPSKSTQPESLMYLRNDEQLTSWQKRLNSKQIATILKVLERLEIDIYTANPEPDFDRLYSNDQKK